MFPADIGLTGVNLVSGQIKVSVKLVEYAMFKCFWLATTKPKGFSGVIWLFLILVSMFSVMQ